MVRRLHSPIPSPHTNNVVRLITLFLAITLTACSTSPQPVDQPAVVSNPTTVHIEPAYPGLAIPKDQAPVSYPTPRPIKPTLTPAPTQVPRPSLPPPPRPTSTPDPNHTPLPAIVGFRDESIEALDRVGCELHQSFETIVEETTYAAFLFSCQNSKSSSILLIYRLEGDQAVLLMDTRSDTLPGRDFVDVLYSVNVDPWGDLNQDGFPDIVVRYNGGGNAWGNHDQVHLWQVTPDGEVVDLLADVYEVYHLAPMYEIKDRNGDGILDLWIFDTRGEWYDEGGHAGVGSFKIYAWPGDQVYDISDQFADLYDQAIAECRTFIESKYGKKLDEGEAHAIMRQAFKLLISYEDSLRRDEGWQVYWELTDPSHWPDATSKALDRIVMLRERHKKQYDAGKEFSAYDQ